MKYKIIALLCTVVTGRAHAFEQLNSLQQLNTKINQNTAVVVKIYRDSCPPCRQLAPILAQFAQKHTEYVFFEVNSSTARDIVNHYNIAKVPTILYFYNGQLKGRDTGSQSYGALEKRTQELLY